MGRGRRGHEHTHQPPPWATWHGPYGGGFGPSWSRGRKARRGDIRTAVLTVLEENPSHGYEVIQRLSERSGGRWRPSAGSVYPTLQLLEDEGLVTGEERDGKRVYSITDAGRAELEERRGRSDWSPPWEGDDRTGPLREAAFSLMGAAMQAARTGNERHLAVAQDALSEARKKIYAALAED
jgi:DNA-binding PadR family transcriptional regulator